MKKTIILAGLLPSLLLARPAPAAPSLPQAETAFSVALYGKLAAQPGNLFFSPYSIATAIGMVYAGAKGGTATQIAHVLHLDQFAPNTPGPALQAAYLRALPQQHLLGDTQADGFKFNAANAIWGADSYRFSPSFLAALKTSFGADLTPLDFTAPAAASTRINGWIADQTQNKIQNLISPDMLTPDTRLLLTNAVYFKAAWATQFDPSATDQEPFHLAPGTAVPTAMMNQQDNFYLDTEDGVQVLTLPYRYNDASMVIILPTAQTGLPAIEAGLTADKLSRWVQNSQITLVAVTLPKFTTTSTLGLNSVLSALGMPNAFNPTHANFTGVAGDPARPLYISAVLHQAKVDVDENGTEAAAATAVIMETATASPDETPPQPVPFLADHPFLYLIRDNQSGNILFMGRITDPTQPGA